MKVMTFFCVILINFVLATFRFIGIVVLVRKCIQFRRRISSASSLSKRLTCLLCIPESKSRRRRHARPVITAAFLRVRWKPPPDAAAGRNKRGTLKWELISSRKRCVGARSLASFSSLRSAYPQRALTSLPATQTFNTTHTFLYTPTHIYVHQGRENLKNVMKLITTFILVNVEMLKLQPLFALIFLGLPVLFLLSEICLFATQVPLKRFILRAVATANVHDITEWKPSETSITCTSTAIICAINIFASATTVTVAGALLNHPGVLRRGGKIASESSPELNLSPFQNSDI